MAAPRRYHVWIGAETGALKGVNLLRKEATNHIGGEGLSRARGVCALCWGDPDQTELLVGSLDRSLSVFSAEKGKFTESRLCPGGEGAFCGLGVLGSSIITAVESGLIRVWGENGAEEPLQELQAGPGLSRMRQNPKNPHLVGTGGKENGLKVWDLQRPGEPLFRAKNVRNDWLDLRVPVWDRDLQFLPGNQRVVTCTGHGQVRLYDLSTPQRRPVLDTTFGESPLTALALVPGDTSLGGGGQCQGELAIIDLRKGRVLRALKGVSGGVRGLQCHPELPLVASCGLDRFLRLHCLRDGTLRDKVYLKSRLTCLLLNTHLDWEAQEEPPPQKGVKDEEVDELWDNMESIQTPRKGKKGKFRGSEGS